MNLRLAAAKLFHISEFIDLAPAAGAGAEQQAPLKSKENSHRFRSESGGVHPDVPHPVPRRKRCTAQPAGRRRSSSGLEHPDFLTRLPRAIASACLITSFTATDGGAGRSQPAGEFVSLQRASAPAHRHVSSPRPTAIRRRCGSRLGRSPRVDGPCPRERCRRDRPGNCR
jgi:hypothetical protein